MSDNYLYFRDVLMTSKVTCPNCGRVLEFNLRNYFNSGIICPCRGGAKEWQDAKVIKLTENHMPDYVKRRLYD